MADNFATMSVLSSIIIPCSAFYSSGSMLIIPFLVFSRVLYATAARLICKAWEINDRVFGNLQVRIFFLVLSTMGSKSYVCLWEFTGKDFLFSSK